MLILGRHLRIVVCVVVSIIHWSSWLILLLLRLIVWASPIHIMLHALPCRQMTTVHHAGVGGYFQTDSDVRGGLDVREFPGALCGGRARLEIRRGFSR